MKKYDVIVIGAGVAGMTAAIYLRRANKKVLVLDSGIFGGQIVNTTNVANWPGDIGVSGAELSQRIYHQMNNLGADFEYAEVMEIDAIDDGGKKARFIVETDEGNYACGAIIIATGTNPRKLEGLGKMPVSYCAACDGALYKDKVVAVVGNGNSALHEALYLSNLAEKVYFVHRREAFGGDAVLAQKVQAKENVEVLVLPEMKDCEARMRELRVRCVFVAIGRIPATAAFADLVELDSEGYVVAGEDCKTSYPGAFVAGDCRTKTIRQLVTAAGDGAVAATDCLAFLS